MPTGPRPIKGKLRLAAYLRVSTDAQATEGAGLQVQRAGIERWARDHDVTITEWFADEGKSGSLPVEDRPGLLAAVNHAQTVKGCHGIVVYRLDRLARQLWVQNVVEHGLLTKGRQLRSVMPSEDDVLTGKAEDPGRELTYGILALVAQYENALRRQRTMAGRNAKRLAGEWNTPVPFGWRRDPISRRLVTDDAQQAVIAKMRAWRAEGVALRTIGTRLAAEGIMSPTGKPWTPETVKRIIGRVEPKPYGRPPSQPENASSAHP